MWHFRNGEGTVLHNVILFMGSFQRFVAIEPCQTCDFKQPFFFLHEISTTSLFHSTGEATLASSLSMGTYRIEVNFQPYFSLTRLVDFCSHPPALTAPSSKFISQAPCLSHLCFQPVISTWLWNLSWRDSYHFPSKVSIVALTLRPFNFLYCFLSRCLENWHPWFRES